MVEMVELSVSQSPQTGQFNSYSDGEVYKLHRPLYFRLNPLKRVNSILTFTPSILVAEFLRKSLNPLKRVNSILTLYTFNSSASTSQLLSQSPQTGQFNSYILIKYI